MGIKNKKSVDWESVSSEEVLRTVKERYPNWAKKHYVKHSRTYLGKRISLSNESAKAIRWHFGEKQARVFQKARKPFNMTEQECNRLELLADYILAEDHKQGLQIRRKPRTWDEFAFAERNRIPMGEGALEFAQLRELSEIPEDVYRKVKICEICEHPFVDPTKNFSKKRCGKACDDEHQRRRQRGRNKKNQGDTRYKRERERQQLEYGFYNPVELREIETHGETLYTTDSFDYGVLAIKSLGDEVVGWHKDKYILNDDWYESESLGEWNAYYNRFNQKQLIIWGEVKTYRIGVDIDRDELERMKFSAADKMPKFFDLGR